MSCNALIVIIAKIYRLSRYRTLISPSAEPVTKISSWGSIAMHLIPLSWAWIWDDTERMSVNSDTHFSMHTLSHLESMSQSSLTHIEYTNIALFSSWNDQLVLWCIGQTRCSLIMTSKRCTMEKMIPSVRFNDSFHQTKVGDAETYMQSSTFSVVKVYPTWRHSCSLSYGQLWTS